MKNILNKNYIILVVLIIVTMFLTFLFRNIYISNKKIVSQFYKYANNITHKEFDEYMMEIPDSIIYISDKYDLSHESQEKELELKIDSMNLKNKVIFIEKKEITKKLQQKLKTDYNISLQLSKTPILIVVVDKKIKQIVYIESDTNINNDIDYGVLE